MSNTQQVIKRHNNPLMWIFVGFVVFEIITADCPSLRWIGPL